MVMIAGQRAGDRGDEDVAVVDVRQLVADHRPQFRRQDRQNAFGDADRGMMGVAAGGEGVGLVVGQM